jgi:hypothetical protein
VASSGIRCRGEIVGACVRKRLEHTAAGQNAYPIDRMVPTWTRAVYWLTDGPHESHRMRIRLIRKLSQLLNGVDISRRSVGDVIDLPRRDAELLIAEGWALAATDNEFEAQPSPGRRATGKPRQ